jgi:hypothetical protein
LAAHWPYDDPTKVQGTEGQVEAAYSGGFTNLLSLAVVQQPVVRKFFASRQAANFVFSFTVRLH